MEAGRRRLTSRRKGSSAGRLKLLAEACGRQAEELEEQRNTNTIVQSRNVYLAD